MQLKNQTIKNLVEKYRHISMLSKMSSLLDWDMNVNLPPQGTAGRSAQIAYITELLTTLWQDPEFKELLKKAQTTEHLTLEEEAIVRNISHASQYFYRVPKELIIEKSKATTEGFMAWQEAKTKNDFGLFLPQLKQLIRLDQTIAQHLGFKDNPYDALLNQFEPGLTTKTCQKIFATLQPELTKLLKQVITSKVYESELSLVDGKKSYLIEDQRRLAVFILQKMGFDFSSGRMDVSSHPFETTIDRGDVRITTRYKLSDLRESFTSAMHEGGHALYEQGINPEYSYTPLEHGATLPLHESQSRFWENQIGRNSKFLEFMAPFFKAFYSDQLQDSDPKTLVKAFNLVKPSLIRVEADEVSYNLHIALRFELEEGLINNKIKPEDLSELWREKMKQYLGVVPDTDREGVLQDVHWSIGSFGYFPTYTLGNLCAAQITKTMKKQLNLDKLVSQGELGTILNWLRENIHQYGSLYWTDELLKKVTGESLNTKYLIEYLKEKYTKIYQLKD